jgi:hypothetical protein
MMIGSSVPATAVTRRNRIGILLSGLLGSVDVATISLADQPRSGGEAGPPDSVIYGGALLGILTIAAGAYAWRRSSRLGLRAVALTRVVSLVLALPALLVEGVPAVYVAGTTFLMVLTLVAVSFLLSRR